MPCKEGLGKSSCQSYFDKIYEKDEKLVAWEGRSDLAFVHLAETPRATNTGNLRQQRKPVVTQTGTPLYLAVLAQGVSPRRRGRTETEQQGLFWGWADRPQLVQPQKAKFIIHPQTLGLPDWAPSLAASVLLGSKEGWHVVRKEGEAAWELEGHKDNKAGWAKELDTTTGPCYFLSVNTKELLLEQDNVSCNHRVNFKLAESFWDFFTSTGKSLRLAVANYNKWGDSHMRSDGWLSRAENPGGQITIN